MILQFKIDKGNVHRQVAWDRNRITALHIAWVVVRISRTFQCVTNHRATPCIKKGIQLSYIYYTRICITGIHRITQDQKTRILNTA